MKRLRGCECHGSGALNNVHGNDAAARRRSHIHRRSWTIAWLHQKSCILKTQMGLGAPATAVYPLGLKIEAFSGPQSYFELQIQLSCFARQARTALWLA